MRPPLAGKRDAARRLAAEIRGRLGLAQPGGAPPRAQAAPAAPAAPAALSSAAARIDAARERLRSTVAPPDDAAG